MTASKWSQKHKTSCTRAEDAYTAAKPVSLRGSNAESSHLCNSFQQKRNKWSNVSCECLLHFPPAPISAQSVKRIAGLRDDGVPVLHVEPIHARLRQLRVVVQEQVVTPRPETQHCGHEQKTKAQIRAKGTTERACLFVKEKTASVISKKMSREGIYPITVIINSKKLKPH